MQTLSEDFADYLSLCEYSTILLSGPLHQIVQCKLSISTQNGVQVKLCKGWRKFCVVNNITAEKCLEFTSDGWMFNNVIIVEII
jgi:hypothetical protein